jgi:transposase
MVARRHISEAEVHAMRKLHTKHAKSTREIGEIFGVSSATVSYWLRSTTVPGDCRRQAPKMSAERLKELKNRRQNVQKLARIIDVRNGRRYARHGSANALRQALLVHHKIKVSKRTVINDLQALGFKSRRRPRIPSASTADYERRRVFCNRIKRNGVKADTIVFTDEKFFNTNDYTHKNQWIQDGVMPEARELSRWPARVMVWGAIGIDYRCLRIIPDKASVPSRLDSKSYVRRILQGAFMNSFDKSRTLMQDGAACHTSAHTRRYLASKNITLLNGWPARSPDLNPIERLWAILQTRVSTHHPDSVNDLVRAIQTEWDAMPQDTINKLVRSFDTTARTVAANAGRWTN